MLNLSTPNFDLFRSQVQNYACLGCSNCSTLSNYDLRTRQGILNYLIAKRECYLTKLETRISQLSIQKEKVEGEIRSYKEFLRGLE